MVNREKTKLQIVYDEIRNTLGKITEDADFEAKELLQAVCGVSRQDLMLGRDVPVSEEQQRKLNEMVRRSSPACADTEPLRKIMLSTSM